MRAWVLCALIGWVPTLLKAAEGDALSPFQISLVHNHVKTYFTEEHPQGGNITAFEHLRPQAPTIELLLKELRDRTRVRTNPTFTARATLLMSLIHDLASRSDMPSPRVKAELQEVTHDLLAQYRRPSPIRHHLLEIFDRFALWSPRETWFVENIRNVSELTEHLHRVRAILQTAHADDSLAIARTLRAIHPPALTPHAMLMETGQMKESELVALFKLASVQFARSLTRTSPEEDEELYNFRLGDPRAHLISSKFIVIMKRLRDGDKVIGSAFTKAFTQAQKASSKDYNREDRLHFFTLLQEGRLNWTNPASWRTEVNTVAAEQIPLRERYRVKGNMILVNFRGGTCEDEL